MDLKEVVKELEGKKNMAKMAREIGGVTGSYLRAIRDGVIKDPSWSMVKKISDYLEESK